MLSPNAKLGMLAVSLETAALALLLMSSHSTAVLFQYFALHALASAAITPVAWAVLPTSYKQPRLWVMLLLFSLSFFIPFIGLFGFATAL